MLVWILAIVALTIWAVTMWISYGGLLIDRWRKRNDKWFHED